MPTRIPARRYLTWGEVLTRLDCTESSLRELIITKSLVPSMFIDAKLILGWWDLDFNEDAGALNPVFRADEAFCPTKLMRRFLFLRHPIETGAMACVFLTFSDSATATPSDHGPLWYEPHRPFTLDDVEGQGVFMLSEIERFVAMDPPLCESKETRQQRRLEQYEAKGASRVPNKKGGWKASGARGALASLAAEEKAAGRPYADVRDVAKDLDAEAARRRGGTAKHPSRIFPG